MENDSHPGASSISSVGKARVWVSPGVGGLGYVWLSWSHLERSPSGGLPAGWGDSSRQSGGIPSEQEPRAVRLVASQGTHRPCWAVHCQRFQGLKDSENLLEHLDICHADSLRPSYASSCQMRSPSFSASPPLQRQEADGEEEQEQGGRVRAQAALFPKAGSGAGCPELGIRGHA